MPEDPHNQKPKPLVTVEFQTEVDPATGTAERRMFVKMYFAARDSGLLADIGDRRWRTLCALVTYMDENGHCFPSQSRIAQDLGTTRETVNKRVRELLEYRFQGRPVMTMTKARLSTAQGGRWSNNVYRILPISGFSIFTDDTTPAGPASEPPKSGSDPYVKKSSHRPYVTKPSHRPVSVEPNTGSSHTNQTQEFNKNVNVNDLVDNAPDPDDATDEATDEATVKSESLTLAILDVTRDPHSLGFYRTVARTVPERLIFQALSETKDEGARGRIRKSRGAFFTATIIRLAQAHGLDLSAGQTAPAETFPDTSRPASRSL